MSIRINDLTVRFKNGVVAVNKASLEIHKGIYGLLGREWCWKKTTLMRVLTTVLKQTEGMVSLDGILYNEGNMKKYRKRLVIFHRKSTYIRSYGGKNALYIWGGLSGVSTMTQTKNYLLFGKDFSYRASE